MNRDTKTEVFVCPPDHDHALKGTCYSTHHCRCDACREGKYSYDRALRARRREEAIASHDPRVKSPEELAKAAAVRALLARFVEADGERAEFAEFAEMLGVAA